MTDKARTRNDGSGNEPAAASASGSSAEPADAVSRMLKKEGKGAAAGPTATEQSVVLPANQATDAQLQRASGGTWSPRRLTAEQTRAVEALQRKGGRLVSPYEPAPSTAKYKAAGKKPSGFNAPTTKPGTAGLY